MAARKLYALRDRSAGRLYIGVAADPQAHAPDGEVVLEVEVADAAVALAYARDALHYWHQGGGCFGDDVPREAIAAVFTTVGSFPPSFLASWIDGALEAEVQADAPPTALLEEVEAEARGAPEPDTSEGREERRRRALEAGLIRGG